MMHDITHSDGALAPWDWLIGFALSAESRETNGGRNWTEAGSLPNTAEPEFSHRSSFTDSHSNRRWFVIVVVKPTHSCWLAGQRKEKKARPDFSEAAAPLPSSRRSGLFCVKVAAFQLQRSHRGSEGCSRCELGLCIPNVKSCSSKRYAIMHSSICTPLW